MNRAFIKLPKRRSTRLKSEVFVENVENALPDSQNDISKESVHFRTKTTPPKRENNIIMPNTGLRRSIRLKSAVFDRHLLNLSDCENAVPSESANNLEIERLAADDDSPLETPKKRKLNSPELDEDFLGSINPDAIADMLLQTNNDNISKRRRMSSENNMEISVNARTNREEVGNIGEQVLETTVRNYHLTQTGNCSMHSENNIEISVNARTNREEIGNTGEHVLETTVSCIEINNCVRKGKLPQTTEVNKVVGKSPNEALKNSTSKASNNNSITKYFKVQNKRFDKEANCEDSAKKLKSIIQNTELNSDSGIANYQQNSVETLENRNKSPLGVQSVDIMEKSANQKKSIEISQKQGNGRSPLVAKHSNDTETPNNRLNSVQISEKRGRGRAPFKAQHTDETETPNNQQNVVQIPEKRSSRRPPLSQEKRGKDRPAQHSDETETPNNRLNSVQTSEKRGRGRPPFKTQRSDETETPNNRLNSVQISEKRGRGRPPCKAQCTDERETPNNQQNVVQLPEKRSRVRPPLKTQQTKTPNNQQNSVEITENGANFPKQRAIKKYTKISKLTKNDIKNVRPRKIPQHRLDDVLSMINDEDHPIWDNRNTSCNPYIFNHWTSRALNSDHNIKIKYARQFLLRRDWISLSKILCMFNASSKSHYPLMAKYATLLLAHTDKDKFNKLIQFLTKFNDGSTVMKACTKLCIPKAE